MLVYLRDGSAQVYMLPHWDLEAADQTFYITQSQYRVPTQISMKNSRSFQGIFFKSQGVFLTQRNMTNDSDSVTHDCTDTE